MEKVRSGATEAEAREGEGGGIVHVVVALEGVATLIEALAADSGTGNQ